MSLLKGCLRLVSLLACAMLPAALNAHWWAGSQTTAGSAPIILSGLAPSLVRSFAATGHQALITAPLGPPQGKLDPALEAFLEGHADFALLTREISEADLATYRSYHGGRRPMILPIAGGRWDRFGYADAVVVIVNRDNPIRSLSFRQIDAIFSATRYRGDKAAMRWGDIGLRGPWKYRPIRLAGSGAWTPEESARALTIKRQILSVGKRSGRWRPGAQAGDEATVVEQVGRDKGAIGFTGMGHIAPGARVVPVSGAHGPAVAPSRASARDGTYPLLRTVDILVDARHASPGTVNWVRFLITPEAQRTIAVQGDFMPLAPPQLARARRLAAQLRCR